MIGGIKGKLLEAKKRSFKNESGEDIEYWRATIVDPDSEWPFYLTIDNTLGEHILTNPAQYEELKNKECMFTVRISVYKGQVKLKATDIQLGATPKS